MHLRIFVIGIFKIYWYVPKNPRPARTRKGEGESLKSRNPSGPNTGGPTGTLVLILLLKISEFEKFALVKRFI
jgi:hypothetical protein